MRANEIAPSKLVVFDIDDTLVHTPTLVHVLDQGGNRVRSLDSHKFTHYQLKPGEVFDFGEFRNAAEFFKKARAIVPMVDRLKRDIATGNRVVMVTARADFDDREVFLNTFRKMGIDMSRVHVYRAGNMPGNATEEKKKIIIRGLLDQGNYSKVIMYDDAEPNLKSFISLKSEYPNIKFYAWHVSPAGAASEYQRSNESSKTPLELVGKGRYSKVTGADDYSVDKTYTRKPSTKRVDPYPIYIQTIVVNTLSDTNPYFPRVNVITAQSKPVYNMERLTPFSELPLETMSGIRDRIFSAPYSAPLKSSQEGAQSIASTLNRAVHSGDYSSLGDPLLIKALKVIRKIFIDRNSAVQGTSANIFKPDLHSENIMVRLTSTGPQLVLTDPLH